MRRCRAGTTVLACVVAALALGACGDDDDDTSASTPAAASTATTGDTGSKLDQATIDYGLKVTGGTAGKADASLAPVKIGFVNQEGGTPSFPEQSAAATAAVGFINDELGGIQGHPLELVRCIVQSEEDGQKCGAQMVNEKLPLVNLALSVVGNDSLHKTIGASIPTLITSPTAASDSTAPHNYSMLGGGAAIVNAMGQAAKALGAKNVAVMGVNNPGGKFATQKALVPTLDALGIKHNTPVYFADDATTPDVASQLQAAGAAKSDAVMFLPSGPQNCTSVYDGLKQLSIDVPVIGTLLCGADSFIDHTGGGPEGWQIVAFGTNPRIESDPEAKVYNAVMDAYGQGNFRTAGIAVPGFSDILLIAKWATEIGADKLTPAAFETTIKAFKGPAPMNPSDISCDPPADAAQPVLCGNAAAVSTFKDGAWQNVGGFKRAPTP